MTIRQLKLKMELEATKIECNLECKKLQYYQNRLRSLEVVGVVARDYRRKARISFQRKTQLKDRITVLAKEMWCQPADSVSK